MCLKYPSSVQVLECLKFDNALSTLVPCLLEWLKCLELINHDRSITTTNTEFDKFSGNEK